MPSKKEPGGPWQVILEEIRSQNRGTIEALDARTEQLSAEIAGVREHLGLRLDVVESVVRQNSADILANRETIGKIDVKVETLSGLVDRVAALERSGTWISRTPSRRPPRQRSAAPRR